MIASGWLLRGVTLVKPCYFSAVGLWDHAFTEWNCSMLSTVYLPKFFAVPSGLSFLQ